MSHDDKILLRQKKQQTAMFREACRRGFTLKAIAFDSGIGYTTIQSYAKADPAVMSITALFNLVDVLPDDLLSMLLPDGRQIVQAPEDVDHDALAEAVSDYMHEKNAAHHPDSPAGRDISPCERAVLDSKVASLPIARAA